MTAQIPNGGLFKDTMTDDMMKKLSFSAWWRHNGCIAFGSDTCLDCSLANRIPRRDCNPPEDCPACPAQERCPCGCRDYHMQLLKSQEN